MKPEKPEVAEAPPKETAKETKTKPCRARDVGHKSCDCGGRYCGARIHER